MDDEAFLAHVSDRLADLPGVEAVNLGGSRAQGTHRPDSDWDFAIYYRSGFDPQTLRVVGWPGEVFEIGGWGDGVFNGGAWLTVDGRRVDVHYRDLAELAISRLLRGDLPKPEYPAALRESAPRIWWRRAELTFEYARKGHAPYGRLAQCAGLVAQATSQAAHAVLARRGEWVTNDKALLTQAGPRQVDEFVAEASLGPGSAPGHGRQIPCPRRRPPRDRQDRRGNIGFGDIAAVAGPSRTVRVQGSEGCG